MTIQHFALVDTSTNTVNKTFTGHKRDLPPAVDPETWLPLDISADKPSLDDFESTAKHIEPKFDITAEAVTRVWETKTDPEQGARRALKIKAQLMTMDKAEHVLPLFFHFVSMSRYYRAIVKHGVDPANWPVAVKAKFDVEVPRMERIDALVDDFEAVKKAIGEAPDVDGAIAALKNFTWSE